MKHILTLLLFIFISTAASAQTEGSHDIALENVSTSRISKRGSAITVKGTMRNIGEAEAQNPMIRYSLNGDTPQRKLNSCKMAQGETFSFSFTVPTKSVAEDGIATLELELAWRDGSVDDNPDNNKVTLEIYLTSAEPNHRMICEEGTGSWCGWCVKGIVGLKKMSEKYGERFIPIAAHTNAEKDPLANATYEKWITDVMRITSYPTCWVNREPTGRNPNFTYIEPYMTAMPAYSDFDVNVSADITDEAFDMTAHIKPLLSPEKTNYHVVFAITEDGLPGVQQNFYFDGNSGEMGGFEKLPMYVDVVYEFVARGMWPSPDNKNLTPFRLPTNMLAGETYEINYRLDASEVPHSELANCSVIAMLIDTQTGQVVNAHKFDPALQSGIHTVLADRDRGSATYNLSGQRIGHKQSGIRIEQGKKVLR